MRIYAVVFEHTKTKGQTGARLDWKKRENIVGDGQGDKPKPKGSERTVKDKWIEMAIKK